MKYFIVDDSASIRAILANIIEDEDLGSIEGEAEDGAEVYADELENRDIDILLIDLLMPNRDGIETVREIGPSFKGKIIMISQVETKDLIGEAYALGVEYYITKPINRLEVVNVLKKVSEHLILEQSIQDIHKSLSILESFHPKKDNGQRKSTTDVTIVAAGKRILLELGIIGENGQRDLLDLLSILYQLEKERVRETPPLKQLYERIVLKRVGHTHNTINIQKEIKACEQRIRRTVLHALEHIAALGLTDYTNPKFESFSSKFFDYSQVRMKMLALDGKIDCQGPHQRINIKKFIQAFYMEARQSMKQ